MSHVPPTPQPAPPPPPPPSVVLPKFSDYNEENAKKVSGSSSFHALNLDEPLIIDELKLKGKEELEIWTTKKNVNCDDHGMLMISSIVQPILQNGPICGLVALAMGAQDIAKRCGGESNTNTASEPQHIFEEAIPKGYTKNGEMFSTENMTHLANSLISHCKAESINLSEVDDREIRNTFLTNCLQGNYLLVPYDADRNHRPGLFKGHSAHWALIHGFALILKASEIETFPSMKLTSANADDNERILLADPYSLSQDLRDSICKTIDNTLLDEVYVVARQGKSSHVGLWPLHELLASNSNLCEIDPKITKAETDFITYPLDTNLKSRIVILNLAR